MQWRLAQVQLRPRKADVEANLTRVVEALGAARAAGAALACFPEASLTGYFLMGGVEEVATPADVVYHELRRRFSETCPGETMEVSLGFYERDAGAIYNSALHARLGPDEASSALLHVHRKVFLPSYGVFDEDRYVTRGRAVECCTSSVGAVATLICEDAWHSITSVLAAVHGAQIILIPSASPGRGLDGDAPRNVRRWADICSWIAEEHGCFVVRTDLVGFEGGKGFAGCSTVHRPNGDLLSEGPLLEERMILTDISMDEVGIARLRLPLAANLVESFSVLAGQFDLAR